MLIVIGEFNDNENDHKGNLLHLYLYYCCHNPRKVSPVEFNRNIFNLLKLNFPQIRFIRKFYHAPLTRHTMMIKWQLSATQSTSCLFHVMNPYILYYN